MNGWGKFGHGWEYNESSLDRLQSFAVNPVGLVHFYKLGLRSISRYCGSTCGFRGRVGGISIGIVNLDRITRINAEDNEPNKLQSKRYIVKPMLLFFGGVFAIGLGWWRLKFCRSASDFCVGLIGLLSGMLLTTWGVLIF
jgi:hypothetical protein